MERVLATEQSDVIIAGAGPAGISTALFLAKKGIRSVLIDKENFPRDKICGDGLSGWVVTMLRRIDPELVTKLRTSSAQLPSGGVRFFAPNMKSLSLPYRNNKFPDEPPGYVIPRRNFDQLLMEEVLKNPLIEVIQGVTITNIEDKGDEIRLSDQPGSHQFTGKICVICTGANSPLTRSLVPGKKNDRHQATGIRQYYSNVTGTLDGNFVDFYFLKEFLPGYLWVFPLPGGGANVGAGIRTDVLKKRKINLKTVMEKALKSNPHLANRFRDARPESGVAACELPLGSKKTRLSGNRFLLAGDSASLVDPFTGEGVGNAMWSGFAAAEHISKALDVNRFDAAFNRRYDRFVYKKLWNELILSTWIQRLIHVPGLFNWVLNKISADPVIQKTVIKMMDDLGVRKKLMNPFFYFSLMKRRKVTP